ncbi:S-adenosyl-L-methionine-dependent methyltransferase [Dentipellis sp. KUC8613]|nr:S-adenosyl-L-methionine-dependent methyltransferase [Dentipellis sp. KUC8613]
MNIGEEFIPTTLDDWTRSDAYHNSFLLSKDPVLEHTRERAETACLPPIAVTPAVGKFLQLLAFSLNAKRVLEVGTLAGYEALDDLHRRPLPIMTLVPRYSAICLARALPDDGRLITLELVKETAEVARQNIEEAGLASKVEVVIGPAAETLASMSAAEPFDLVFLDADKENLPIYFAEAKRLVKKRGVIVVDNMVRNGRTADPSYTDEHVPGLRRLLQCVKDDPEVDATTVSTVGEKGYDGFMYAWPTTCRAIVEHMRTEAGVTADIDVSGNMHNYDSTEYGNRASAWTKHPT